MAQPYPQPCDQGLIDAQPCPRAQGRELPDGQKRWVLIACILASSMAFIDGSALTVALPALRADFAADLSFVQWVVNGYVLALASLTLIGGAMADVYGKSRMLMVGTAGFGLASILCALAPSPELLIAGRILQGVAAAILTPASLALIGAAYPKAERGGAIGAWAAASALTMAGGPLLGGFLTENFGWQAIFWINVPLSVLAAGILITVSVKDYTEPRRFDFPGAGLIALALGAIAGGLSMIVSGEAGGDLELNMNGVPWLLGGLVGLGLYWLWERRTDHPMTPPRLFANRTFTALNSSTLLIYAGLSILFFLLPFELIDRRGLSAIETGLIFLPFTLGVGLLSRLFGFLADKFGPQLFLSIGPVFASFAYFGFAVFRDGSLMAGVILPMGFLGLAFAAIAAPITAAVMSSVSDSDEGLASGMNNAASRIAQLAGVALAAAVAAHAGGYLLGLGIAAGLSFAGALINASIKTELPEPAD